MTAIRMTNPRLSVLAMIVLTLAAAGCDRLDQQSYSGSVTVRLPPAQTAAPGFQFDGKGAQR